MPIEEEEDASISKIYFVKKPYMFRTSSLPIIRSYPLYTRQLGIDASSWLFYESYHDEWLPEHKVSDLCFCVW